ncbi:YesL family protein [Jeotgalibaca caeni]|uniref:YesL family protein n=1 Tax=Jeotgalibaca caeni TaxID=3028623 RepID=UPI00237E33D2|nr:DUF624 domain-containing protein [Jeotgalibaca caeni]MDE1547595.1 DUF624 domain-containing protein [Jeotgalibaca caeni]
MTTSSSFFQKVYSGLNHLYICAILQALFVLGFVLGLGIFGLGPSFVTTMEVAKEYHQHKLTKPLRVYLEKYKKNFVLANKVFLPQCIVFAFIEVDKQINFGWSGEVQGIFLSILVITQFLLFISMMTSGALLTSYWLRPLEAIKKSMPFIFYNIGGMLLIILWTGICYYGSLLLPGLIPFFSFGLWIVVIEGMYLRLFENNEERMMESQKEQAIAK